MQNKIIKILLSVLFMTIIFVVFVSGYIINMKSNIEDSVLRLHIVGASDNAADQSLKLCVRNRILADFSDTFSQCTSVEDSVNAANENLEKITAAAKDELKKRGCPYPVTASVEKCRFPTKKYGSVILPAGIYTALNIKIGLASGQNWWCVMYPPLCITDTTVEIPESSRKKLESILSAEEYRLICENSSPDIKIKFKIAEILGKYFR